MFKKIIFLVILVISSSFVINFLKLKSKSLEDKILIKKDEILDLEKKIKQEVSENNYLKTPERIEKLAKKYLSNDYIFYKKENIKEIKLPNE